MSRTFIITAASLIVLAACASPSTEGLPPAEVPAPPVFEDAAATDMAAVEAAIANPARPETDVERDEMRRPAGVMEFMGVQPGDTLLEMEAGGGYFTEILSAYLGEAGTVYMQNPAAFQAFLGESLEPRFARWDNVEYVEANFDDLPLEDASVDIVTWFQGPHELWYTPEGGGPLVDNVEASFPEIMRVLKPGGSFVVLDHTAPAGSPATTGGETHRIDPQIIRDMAERTGFVLIAESDLLANPDDDLDASVFDDKVRGMTDQFLLRFEKPEAAPE